MEELPYLSDEVLYYDEEDEGDGGDPFLDEEFIRDLLKRTQR